MELNQGKTGMSSESGPSSGGCVVSYEMYYVSIQTACSTVLHVFPAYF